MGPVYLSDFLCPSANFQKQQFASHEWLIAAYRHYQKEQSYSETEYRKLLNRVGVSDQKIESRGHFLADFRTADFAGEIFAHNKIGGISERQKKYLEVCENIIHHLFEKRPIPKHLIHVTCTGYISPSPVQILAAEKSPESIVTHSYHMGCYGAFPAIRMASGFLRNDSPPNQNAVDIIHTELCTLHLNPQDPSLEQMLIQTLFADGVAVYRAGMGRPQSGFELIHLSEFLISESREAMQWGLSEQGFQMTLSKDVPALIAANLKSAIEKWENQAGVSIRNLLKNAIVAVHPGGPKIIDLVCETLELQESQVRFSRKVLKEKGNMSSVTVPHIWNEILQDNKVQNGTDIVSMAFGPGLTLCLSLMKLIH